MIPPMTTPCRACATVEQILYAEINVMSFPLACNFDPVLKARDGAKRPATATVVRNVLIQEFRQIRLAVDVVPAPIVWDVVLC